MNFDKYLFIRDETTPSMEQKLSEAGSLAVQFPNSVDFEVRRLHQFGSDWFTITIWHIMFSEAFVVACIGISYIAQMVPNLFFLECHKPKVSASTVSTLILSPEKFSYLHETI